MTLGMLFTMFVSWVIGTLGLIQFFIYLRQRSSIIIKLLPAVMFFSTFWFGMGFVWIFVGITDYFAWSENFDAARLFAHVFQFIVGIDLLILWLYYLVRFFPPTRPRKHMERILLVLVSMLIIVFQWTLFTYGFHERPPNYFALQFILNTQSQLIFGMLFIPTFLLAIVDGARASANSTLPKDENIFVMLASLSLILLGIGGALEEFGAVKDSFVPASRILTLMASMSAYIAITYIVGTRLHPKVITI